MTERELVEQAGAAPGDEARAHAHAHQLEERAAVERVAIVGLVQVQVAERIARGDVGVEHGGLLRRR